MLVGHFIELACFDCGHSVYKIKTTTNRILSVIQDGEQKMKECVSKATSDIRNTSTYVTFGVDQALDLGQSLLDTLSVCSQKLAFQQIGCYKRVIANDVFPVKLALLEAIHVHKSGHMEAISIRGSASECVHDVLKRCKMEISELLSKTLSC